MRWWRRRVYRDSEIAPDEIFLDASNAPDFNQESLEGRLEKPLPRSSFFLLGVGLAALFLILFARSWYLQVTHGAEYASESANNSLEAIPIFAPRGIITDIHGEALVENRQKENGIVERNYLIPSLGQVIGYVSYPKKDSSGVYYETRQKGVTALEATYDWLLAGENGKMLTETDAVGRVRSEGIVVPAKEGKTLRLSIDAGLQKPLAGAIASIARTHKFIAGAGVIMDVRTGAVRALVSYPFLDANVMSSGSPAETIAAYNRDPGRPFLDHAVQGVYAPGSIVKPIVAAGALTDGIITPSTLIDDPGSISLSDPYRPGKSYVYKGWKPLGIVDVKRAIAWSSDIFFYEVGGGFKGQRGLGIERLGYWYRQFGLGSTTAIDLPEESPGLIPTPAWKQEVFNEPWYLGDTYFTAIGQYSMQVTPIQMVRAAAAIANGGKLFTPTLIEGQVPSSTVVPVDQAALAVVRQGMRQTVTSALAQALNVPYVSVAAKTGTAQTGTRNQYDNSWVIGFFPYEDPQYAFSVVLERGPEGSGSQAVNVMQQLLSSLYAENSPYVVEQKLTNQ